MDADDVVCGGRCAALWDFGLCAGECGECEWGVGNGGVDDGGNDDAEVSVLAAAPG